MELIILCSNIESNWKIGIFLYTDTYSTTK